MRPQQHWQVLRQLPRSTNSPVRTGLEKPSFFGPVGMVITRTRLLLAFFACWEYQRANLGSMWIAGSPPSLKFETRRKSNTE